MTSLLKYPSSVLYPLLGSWISCKELMTYDFAVCNRHVRPLLLNLFSNENFTTIICQHTQRLLSRSSNDGLLLLRWLVSRHLRTNKLVLHSSTFSTQSAQISRLDVQKVVELIFICSKVTPSENCGAFIANCSALTSVTVLDDGEEDGTYNNFYLLLAVFTFRFIGQF